MHSLIHPSHTITQAEGWVFRRSENTNDFGLRGYWVAFENTGKVFSFATSDELKLGKQWLPTFEGRLNYELVRDEGQIKEWSMFERDILSKLEK